MRDKKKKQVEAERTFEFFSVRSFSCSLMDWIIIEANLLQIVFFFASLNFRRFPKRQPSTIRPVNATVANGG
jgi:hypothetical protein